MSLLWLQPRVPIGTTIETPRIASGLPHARSRSLLSPVVCFPRHLARVRKLATFFWRFREGVRTPHLRVRLIYPDS